MTSHAILPPMGLLTEIVESRGVARTPDVARELMSLRLKDDAKELIRELLEKRNAGTITATEQATLESYLMTGELLDLLHLIARRTLRAAGE